jgi:hypothetical protein
MLAACDAGLGTRGGLVVNSTTRDLVIEVVGADEPYRLELPPQTSAQSGARNDECLGNGVAIYSSDGELLTRLDERICAGHTLRIDDDDLPSTNA